MSRIRIVTDSTSDLSADVAERLGIYVIPLKVIFGVNVYRDGVDIDKSNFYQRLQSEIAATSPPDPIDFLDIYEKCMEMGESVISIHISSHLSATLQSAQKAKDICGYKDIFIIDSLSASAGLGLMAMAAAKAANEGKNREEIIEIITKIRESISIYFVVDTLEYLVRGGRLSRIEGFVGSLLNIKPVLAIKDGVIVPIAKIMGKSRAAEKIFEIAQKDNVNDNSYMFSLIKGNGADGFNSLESKIKEEFHCREVVKSEFGPVIGTHVGPKVFGMAYYNVS